MCFGAVGSAIGDVFHSVDTVANEINPFKGITDWGTKNTLAKIPGVGKPLGQLADWGDSHPAEVGAGIAAGWGAAAYLGAGAAGAAGDAGLAAGEGGAGEAGAAASGAVGASAGTGSGLAAGGAAAGGAAAGAASAADAGAGAGAGAAAPATTNSWLSAAGTAAKYVAPAVVSSLLAPKPPKTRAPTAMPDPLAQQQAAQQKVIAQMARRGRASTILTNPGNSGGSLGG